MVGMVDPVEFAAIKSELERERQALADLRHALQSLGSAMSHDLRGPARHVSVFSDLIARDDQLGDEVKAHVGRIQQASEKLFRLIDTFSSYTKQLSRQPFLGPVDIRACMIAALEAAGLDENSTSVALNLDDLPTVLGDEAMIVFVLGELIDNAVRHGQAELPGVGISGQVEGDEVCVQIADNGAGLAPPYLDRMFDLNSNFQLDSSQDVASGLASAKALMQAQHGQIEIDRDHGPGLCLRLRFKAGHAGQDDLPAPPKAD